MYCSADDAGNVSTSTVEKEKTVTEDKPLKVRRLSNLDINKFVLEHEIKDVDHLMTVANQREKEGEDDLSLYIMNKACRGVSEVIETAWEMHNSEAVVRRRQMTRLQILQEAHDGICGCATEGRWLEMALQVHLNIISLNSMSY